MIYANEFLMQFLRYYENYTSLYIVGGFSENV